MTFICPYLCTNNSIIFCQPFLTIFFVLVKDIHVGTRSTRQSDKIFLHQYRTNQGQKTVKYVGGKLWNSLPSDIKLAPNVEIFKSRCKNYLLHE